MLRSILAAYCGLLVCFSAAATLADDYFLTIGGGYSPAGNQVSLEKNIVFFRSVLSDLKPAGAEHDVYFADGNSPGSDVQFDPAGDNVPRANLLMARLFGSERYLELQYRNNALDGVRGQASRENIKQWFEQVGSKLSADDRLVLYVTAHGGKSANKKNPHNTKLYLWNRQSIEVSELVGHLQSLPAGVRVVLVMVQCYSGGYAHVLFNEANASKGDVERDICGFYATVHNRVAAGCTADINEENYEEYSSSFWAAIRGQDRVGQAVPTPDYDGDGSVSLEEAHAYTVLTSNTVDIPIKTSGAYLRARSKLQGKDHPDLLGTDVAYSALLSHASPVQQAVLEGFSTQFELSGDDRTAQIKKKTEALQKQRKELENKGKEKKKRYDQLKKEMQQEVRARWPELSNVLTPVATRLLTTDAAAFVDQIESHKHFSEFSELYQQRERMSEQRLALEKQWVKYQRWNRVAENVVRAANLPKVADAATIERYEQIVTAEQGKLGE